MSDIQPIPEEMQKWVTEKAYEFIDGEHKVRIADMHDRKSFESGAFTMYNKMQPELESLRKERDEYRIALGLLSACLEKDYPSSFAKIRQVLDQYPTEQTDKSPI